MGVYKNVSHLVGFSLVSATTGLADTTTTPTCYVAKDTGNFTQCENAASRKTQNSTATNMFHLTLTDAEMNADLVEVMVAASGCVPPAILLYPESDYTSTKAGYLDASISGVAGAVWNYLTSAATTANSIGKKLADWAVGQVKDYDSGKDPGAYVLATPAQKLVTDSNGQVTVGTMAATPLISIASAIWQSATSGMNTAGSVGKKLADWVVGKVLSFDTSLDVAKASDVSGLDIPTVEEVQVGLAKATDVSGAIASINEHTDAQVAGLDIPTVEQNQNGLAKSMEVTGAVTSINGHTDMQIAGLTIPSVPEIQTGLVKSIDVTGIEETIINGVGSILPEAPYNTAIAAIQNKIAKMQFDTNNNILASASVSVGSVDLTEESVAAVKADLAKTTDLTGLAKTTDLDGLAKTTDLNGLAKITDLPAAPDNTAIQSMSEVISTNLDDKVSDIVESVVGGPIAKVFTVYADSAKTIPLAGCKVWLTTDEAGTQPSKYGAKYSNDDGHTIWHLDSGVTYYPWCAMEGKTFTNPAEAFTA